MKYIYRYIETELMLKSFSVFSPAESLRLRGCVVTGPSPSSTPSAKSPGPEEEEEQEPPQLSVKREFSLAASGKRENSEGAVTAVNEEEEDSQQSNLLDCLVQAQNFAIQQAAGNKNFENNINNFPSGHLMQGEDRTSRPGASI